MKRLICIANIDWNFSWQRAQIFMSALAKEGFKIIFINNTGFAKIKLGDTQRIYNRLFPSKKEVPFPTPHNIKVLSPLVLPLGVPFKTVINNKTFYPKLLNNLINEGFDRPDFLYTFLPTDISTCLIVNLKPKKVIYDYVGDFFSHPRRPKDLLRTHTELLKNTDLVLTDNTRFYEFLISSHPNVHIIHNGVSDLFFFKGEQPLNSRPKKLCYFGSITKSKIDFELINNLASHDFLISMVGPVIGALPRLHKNIQLKGMMRLEDLADELKANEVIIFPYLKSNFNDSIMPAKVYQSLASGKPIISINLPLLWAEEYKNLFYLADNNQMFIDLLNSLPQTENLNAIEERQTFAASNHQSLYSESLIQLINKLDLT